MARNLANQVNVDPPDGQFPSGRIRDNNGTGNGTPYDEAVYGDIHQFFMKLVRESGIVLNDLPDEEALNQLYNAFVSQIGTIGGTQFELTANKGAANGYAPLDGSGQVPAINLPSFVDDVLEFPNLAAFPMPGETGKIYVALDTNKTYRWSGATYIEISAGNVNSVFGRQGNVLAAFGDYAASLVSFVTYEGIGGGNVQTAIEQLKDFVDAVAASIPVVPSNGAWQAFPIDITAYNFTGLNSVALRYRLDAHGDLELDGSVRRTAAWPALGDNINANPIPAQFRPANQHRWVGATTGTDLTMLELEMNPNGILEYRYLQEPTLNLPSANAEIFFTGVKIPID